MACIYFEEADRVKMGVGCFVHVERAIEVGGVGWTVIAFNWLEGVWSETVVAVEVGCSALYGLLAA